MATKDDIADLGQLIEAQQVTRIAAEVNPMHQKIDKSGWRVPSGDPGTPDAVARMKLRSQQTDDVIWRYFVRAGLSEDWLQYLRRSLRTHDLWQSGRDSGSRRAES